MTQKSQWLSWALSVFTFAAFGNPQSKEQVEPAYVTAVEPASAVTTPGTKVMVLGANFSPDSVVYFGGLEARSVTFVNPSALRAVTPYLRPGTYKLDVKSGETVIHSNVVFTALPSSIDLTFDQANDLADKKQGAAALRIFLNIASTHPDYDVRAYASFRSAQLYLEQGDYWGAAGQAAWVFNPKASVAVQSNWRYLLLQDEMAYSVSVGQDRHDTDLRVADASIKWDESESPELRAWRALLSARFGKTQQAKEDLKFILAAEPKNVSYRALAAYIGVLSGDQGALEGFRGQSVTDLRALRLLGQAEYIRGDTDAARGWWASFPKAEVIWARLDYLAGRKHLKYGQARVGAALIAECAAVIPDSKEGKEAAKLLADLGKPQP